jgi:hypothetical protein
MSPEIVNDIAPIVGFIAFGFFVIAGMKIWLAHRRAMRQEAGSPELDQVLEEVAALREDLRTMRGGLVELEERMDFTERVLARPKEEAPAPRPRNGG